MSDPERVLRLLDPESGASDAVRYVMGASEAHEPSAEALASLQARLASQLPLGALPTPAPAAGAAGSAKAAVGALVKGVAGLVVVATLGAGSYGLLHGSTAVDAKAPSAAPSAPIAPASPAAPVFPVLEVAAEPSPATAPAASPGPRSTPTPPSGIRREPVASTDLPIVHEPEATLLSRAHDALLRGDSAGALSITQDHARLYPKGILVQERERIAIEALVAAGDTQRARARLDAFCRTYPDSPHRGRLDALLPP